MIIGGEFGRTPAVEAKGGAIQNGRDHNTHRLYDVTGRRRGEAWDCVRGNGPRLGEKSGGKSRFMSMISMPRFFIFADLITRNSPIASAAAIFALQTYRGRYIQGLMA